MLRGKTHESLSRGARVCASGFVLAILAACGAGETSLGAPSTGLEQPVPREQEEPVRAFDRTQFDRIAYQGTVDLLRGVDGGYRSEIRIENRHDGRTEVLVGIENLLFIDREDILQSIERMPEQYAGEPDYRKAWRFVATRTYHASSLSEQLKQHDPLLYFNSIGSGFCDDANAVLATIWEWQGYASRVWGLSGHVVAEVGKDGEWMTFDADYGAIYLDAAGKIASVEQLAVSPELVSRPNDPVRPESDPAYAGLLADLYSSVDDNFVFERIRTEEVHPLAVALPPRSSLSFPVPFDEPILAYDGEPIPVLGAGQIEIPAGSEAVLDLPFVVLAVQGSGELVIDGVAYEIGSEEARHRLRGDATIGAHEGRSVTSVGVHAKVESVRVVFAMSPFVTAGARDARLVVLQRSSDMPAHVSIARAAQDAEVSPVSMALADAVRSGWSSPVWLRSVLDALQRPLATE